MFCLHEAEKQISIFKEGLSDLDKPSCKQWLFKARALKMLLASKVVKNALQNEVEP